MTVTFLPSVKLVKLGQFTKALSPMVSTPFPRVMSDKIIHPLNTFLPILVILSPITIVDKLLQSKKALSPIALTLFPIVMLTNCEDPLKQSLGIGTVISSEIITVTI